MNFHFVEDPDCFKVLSEEANQATEGRNQEDMDLEEWYNLQLKAKFNANVITYWNALD